MDVDATPLRESVDNGYTDAMKAARDFVAVLVKFAAGVQSRHYDLERAEVLARVPIHGDSATVVDNRDDVIFVDNNVYTRAVPGQRLVDTVIDDLVYEMMETIRAGAPDIHTGTLPNRF
jgi:hypothetical protein